MSLLIRIALNGLGLWAAAQLLPGIHYDGGWLYLLLAGFVLGAVNLLVKPIVTGKGMNFTAAPSRATPMAISSTPAIIVATARPS